MIPKRLLILALGGTLVVFSLYFYLAQSQSPSVPTPILGSFLLSSAPNITEQGLTHESCSNTKRYSADIETADMFPTLELEPEWMERREYWGNQMEDRCENRDYVLVF